MKKKTSQVCMGIKQKDIEQEIAELKEQGYRNLQICDKLSRKYDIRKSDIEVVMLSYPEKRNRHFEGWLHRNIEMRERGIRG